MLKYIQKIKSADGKDDMKKVTYEQSLTVILLGKKLETSSNLTVKYAKMYHGPQKYRKTG